MEQQHVIFQSKIIELFTLHGQTTNIERGHHIFQEGERAGEIYYIKNGAIQISQQTESGKEITIRICSTDSIIGENAMFCHIQYHSTTATALEPSTIMTLSTKELEMLLSNHPTLLMDYLNWIQIENIKNQTRMRDLVIHGKKGALFSTLIRLANTYGIEKESGAIFINMSLTNTEIANLCATSREMINRMLNDLKKHQIISFEKGHITIYDLEFLKKEIECANCPLAICRID